MSRFRPITFEYKGRSYTVPADKMMGLIDTIEEHITLAEIYADGNNRKTLRFGKLAAAYAASLNYAGAEVTAEEVYLSMFGDASAEGAETKAFNMMLSLLTVMTPPQSVVEKLEKTTPATGSSSAKKPAVAGAAGKGSSRKPSSSPQARKKAADGV